MPAPTTELFGPRANLHRRTIRSTPNPLDKATVVSIYPVDIDEKKHTIQPGRFVIPAGSLEKPSLTIVGPSSWWRDIDLDQPLLEITNSAIQVADSIVIDYANGLLGYKKEIAEPGLFWVPGAFKDIEILKKTQFFTGEDEKKNPGVTGADLLARAARKQKAYWEALVKLADIGWSKTNGSPLCINDHMRLAASILGFKDKPWMKDMQMLAMVNCPFCGTLANPLYPICANCKQVINKDEAKKLGYETPKGQ